MSERVRPSVDRGLRSRMGSLKEKALSLGLATGISMGAATATTLISPSEAFAKSYASALDKTPKKDNGKEEAATKPKSKKEQQFSSEQKQQIQTLAEHITATQKLTTPDIDSWMATKKPDGEENRLFYKGIEVTHLSLFGGNPETHFVGVLSLFNGPLTLEVKGKIDETVTLAFATIPIPANNLHPNGRMVTFPAVVNLNVHEPGLSTNQLGFTDFPYDGLYPSQKNFEIDLGRVQTRDEYLTGLTTHIGEPAMFVLVTEASLKNYNYKTTPGTGIFTAGPELGKRDASFGVETNRFYSLFERLQYGTTGNFADLDKAVIKGVKNKLFFVSDGSKDSSIAATDYVKNVAQRITTIGETQDFLKTLFEIVPLSSIAVFDKGVISGPVVQAPLKP